MSDAPPSGASPPRGHIDRRQLALLVVPVLLLVVASNVGNALGPRLQDSHPLLLVALSPLIRWQLLVVNKLDWWTFFPVAAFRMFIPDPFFYVLGHRYGDRAVKWAAHTYGVTRAIPDLDQGLGSPSFQRILRPLVVIAPNNPICLLAGAAAMPVAEFWTLNVIGTAGRLALIRLTAGWLSDEISTLADFMTDNQKWFLLASVSVVVITIASQLLRSRGEITGLIELAEDLDEE